MSHKTYAGKGGNASRMAELRQVAPWNTADEDGHLTLKMTEIEMTKAGIKTSKKDWDQMTRSEMLNERNLLRRTANQFIDKGNNLSASGKADEAEHFLKVAAEVARQSACLGEHMNLMELADEAAAGGSGVGNFFGAADGKRVQVLGKDDRMVDHARGAFDRVDFGFGEYVAAMVGGTNRADIRAALSEGTDSAGGYTVPKHLLSQLIDRMRSKTVVVRAGALTVPLETQQTTIARIASDPAAGWRLENAALAESDPTFEGVTFTARSLAVLVKVSRELLEDSVNIDQALMMAFAGSLAGELDRVALFGSGTAPEPRGVFNTTNVNSVSMGTNGAQLTSYGKLLDCLYELEADNANTATAQIMHPRTWRVIQGFADTTGQPLQPPPALAVLPQMTTTNVPINQTQGTANNASSIIVGDFTQMMIGIRQEMRVEVLREKFADNHQYGFVAHLRADIALAHPESFCKLIGVIP